MVNIQAPAMGGSTIGERIDAVDAFARTIYVRAKQCSSPVLSDVAPAVRQLHLALRYLRVEITDGESVLNSPDGAVFTRQLQPIVEDCDFALKQMDTVLEKYGSILGSKPDAEVVNRIDSVTCRLVQEKTNVDMFLDTIQLHNPSGGSESMVQEDQAGLDDIKLKVDTVAARLFSRREAGLTNDEGRLWKEFKAELEKEGFSPEILRKHKEVLRAYIRELDSLAAANGGTTPTVQRLLEYEANSAPQPVEAPQVPPKIPLKEMNPSNETDKYMPSMKFERRMPGQDPVQTEIVPYRARDDSFSGPEDSGSDISMALISTMDLVAMDTINNSFANMQLQAQPHQAYSTSPNSSYNMPGQNMSGALAPAQLDVTRSPQQQYQQLASSPRFYPYTPATQNGQTGMPTRNASHLAPDSYGQPIPMEAQWTKVKRSLVSPEVLGRAGVRYEARPEYVAILGRLSREQISEFARQSAECRRMRYNQAPPPPSVPYERGTNGNANGYANGNGHGRGRADSRSSHEDLEEEDQLWDDSDSTDYDDDKTSDRGNGKGTKSYPYIVSAPTKDNTSPTSTAKPKPILKNKNENHVHFGPDPYEVDPRASPPRSSREDRRRNDRHDHGSSRRHRDDARHRDSRRDGDRYRYDNDGHHRNSHHHDRSRDREDERAMRKKTRRETLGAVGIGGAAVSLLTVLAHAAVGV